MEKRSVATIVMELEKNDKTWQRISVAGGNDPYIPDGMLLNVLRYKIVRARDELKNVMGDGAKMPEICNHRVPPELSPDFMVKADEIIRTARAVLIRCEADVNYQFLTEATAKKSDVLSDTNALDFVRCIKKLQQAMAVGDIINIKRCTVAVGNCYIEAFAQCADRVQEVLQNPVDMRDAAEWEDEMER